MSGLRLERCPVCRAGLRGDEPLADPCRRCAADLTLVRATERRAEALQGEARQALACGDAPTALTNAWKAVALVDHASTRATLCAALAASDREADARALLADARSISWST